MKIRFWNMSMIPVLLFITLPLVHSMDPDIELLKAVRSANPDAALKALRNGADVNTCSPDLQTPLHLVTYEEYASTPIIETSYNNLYPAICLEYRNGKPKLTKILLDAGADSNAQNSNGCTPFNLALMNGSMQIAGLIKSYSEILQQIHSMPTKKLLTQAIHLGFVSLVKLLLQSGVKPDLHDLALVKQKYIHSLDEFDKNTYATIGRMLLQHLQLTGILQAPKHKPNTVKKFYRRALNLLQPTHSSTADHTYGPISKSGIAQTGLPDNIIHIIASFTH